jgi:hypothetical protein
MDRSGQGWTRNCPQRISVRRRGRALIEHAAMAADRFVRVIVTALAKLESQCRDARLRACA